MDGGGRGRRPLRGWTVSRQPGPRPAAPPRGERSRGTAARLLGLPRGSRRGGGAAAHPRGSHRSSHRGGGAAAHPWGSRRGSTGAAGGLPTPGTRSDAPAAPGNRPVAVSVVSSSAFEEAPPPYSPPDPKSFHLFYPPYPAGYAQQGPVIYPPGPGPRPFPAPGFPPGPLPYSAYHGQPGPSPAGRGHQRPKDYTVESVLVTIFCCLITGVMALVYSHETRAALARGDMVQAYLASKKAQSLVLISLLFGLFASISWIVYVLVSLYL
ncbi:proline rich transmembrane protein 1B [Geothlypis trichas]